MKLHSERKPATNIQISRIMSRFLAAEKKFSPILLWSVIVGILTGVAAALFQISIEKVALLREVLLRTLPQATPLLLAASVIFSAVLVFLAFLLVRKVVPRPGQRRLRDRSARRKTIRWKNVLPVKFIGDLALEANGPRREGPTIHRRNIGKMVADFFKAGKEDTHALIAAGAGGGLTAAFNAPLAGILFVFEEMRPEFKYNFLSVQSVILASAASDIALRSIMGQGPEINMQMLAPPPLTSLWLFLIFGLLFGILGAVFIFLLIRTFRSLLEPERPSQSTFTGLYVGVHRPVAWLYPDMAGGGYKSSRRHFRGDTCNDASPPVLRAVRDDDDKLWLERRAAYSRRCSPRHYSAWYRNAAHGFLPGVDITPEMFAVAGMAALFCATVRAPLTGIAITIEMTGNYFLILPLILTCLTATLVAEGLGGKPVYTLLLKRALSLARK
jgi:CIC family chloride channel protein